MNPSRNRNLILFGVLSTFFSGFGQTYFFGVQSGEIQREFALSRAEFGALYSGATLLSASLLPWAGGLLDKSGIRAYAACVGIGLILSALSLAFVPVLPVLFLAVAGVRFFGQGLMSHAAQTTISRYFERTRGRTLSISGLGYPLSEGLLPPVFAALLIYWGWRANFMFAAGCILIIYLPLITTLVPKRNPAGPVDIDPLRENEQIKSALPEPSVVLERDWRPGMLLKNPWVWLILPLLTAPPFLMTGLFFYQESVAEAKGWTLLLHARFFMGFAVARTIGILVIGPLIDRFDARKLQPFYLFPLIAGMAFLLLPEPPPLFGYLYLFLAGITIGIGGPIKTAFLAETFGTKHLGGNRSLFASVMVFSTALATPVFGYLLDFGLSFEGLITSCIALSLAATLIALPAFREFARSSDR